MSSKSNVEYLNGSLCSNCFTAVSFRPKGGLIKNAENAHAHGEGFESGHVFSWADVEKNRHRCSLCNANYAAFELDGEKDCQPAHVTILKRRIAEGLEDLQFRLAYEQNFGSWLLKAQVSTNSPDDPEMLGPLWTHSHSIPFTARAQQLREQLRVCQTSHPECKNTSNWLPTRLIAIEKAVRGQERVRLINSKDLLDRAISYSTLSHCWGSYHMISTTRETLTMHMENIPMDVLPKTFIDAIKVTSALGISYLWIDSLCIIQDDHHDWEMEAAAMARIFGNCELTIMASGAADSHGGLFLESIAPPVVVLEKEGHQSTMVRWPKADVWSIRHSRLDTRGWVYQETLLSKRKVLFQRDQLYWHCRSWKCAEDESHSERGFFLFLGREGTKGEANIWPEIVSVYSQKAFTYRTDRMAALAGIIEWYQSRSLQSPLFGLWKENMQFGLVWWLSPYKKPYSSSPIPGLPTWTWLAWDCSVEFYQYNTKFAYFQTDFEVLSCHATWSGSPWTSEVVEHGLRVKGRLKRNVKFDYTIKVNKVFWRMADFPHGSMLKPDHVDANAVNAVDTPTFSKHRSADCLIILHYKETKFTAILLVLERVSDSPEQQVYRRLGLGYLAWKDESPTPSILTDAEICCLDLV